VPPKAVTLRPLDGGRAKEPRAEHRRQGASRGVG
jgi:hypothetical protein